MRGMNQTGVIYLEGSRIACVYPREHAMDITDGHACAAAPCAPLTDEFRCHQAFLHWRLIPRTIGKPAVNAFFFSPLYDV